MPAMARPNRPTDAELAILRVLWRRGPSTVREVLDANPASGQGYTTVLKLLQIMADKGLVLRDERERTHVYRAARGEEHTQRQLVGDLLERAFGGSAKQLILRALDAKRAPPVELREIRKLIEDMTKEPQQ
jgi:BlaI family transcriptional regulator, penicillinase repressor